MQNTETVDTVRERERERELYSNEIEKGVNTLICDRRKDRID